METDTSDRRLITAEEAARFLGLKVSTIRRLTAQGGLPCVRPTGKRAVRYRLRDLEDLARLRSAPMRESQA
jgi:excisionase family DNA binding protein